MFVFFHRFSRAAVCLSAMLSAVLVFSVFSRGSRAEPAPPAHLDNAVYGGAPLTVQFNGADLGLSGELTYHWDFGDGESSSAPDPQYTYVSAGQYTACLTVKSDEGTNASCTVTVYVEGEGETSRPPEDVNEDCKVNILDMIRVRNNLQESATGNQCDINGDGTINVLDMIEVRNGLGTLCTMCGDPPPPEEEPEPEGADWEYPGTWEKIGIATPKSDDGTYAQRAQLWDFGETIPFTFNATVDKLQGTVVDWACTVRNYWGELLQSDNGTATVGEGGGVTASSNWTADCLGIIKIDFECDGAHASMYVAVIKPMGDLWDAAPNAFGAMAQHPGYDEYEPYLDLQKRLGMKTLRIPVGTESVAPNATDLNTGLLDSVLDPVNDRGFNAYLLFAYFPNWMKEGGVWKPEWEDIDARIGWFADFVGRAVSYCKTKGVSHYEIWNEPNLGHFWGWGEAKYCELLEEVHLAAKASDPDCVVISGGMPGLPSAFTSMIGDALVEGNSNDDYDILAGHYYRIWGGYSPEHPKNNMYEGFKEAAARANIAGKPTWDTESDYGFFHQSEWESMNWYGRQIVYMLAAGVEKFTLYGFSSAKEKLGYTSAWWHNFFGMMANAQLPTFAYDNWPTQDDYRNSVDCFVYTPLPKCPAYSAAAHELVGAADWAETTLPDDIGSTGTNVLFLYKKGDDVRAVCWRGYDDYFQTPEEAVRGLQIALQPVAMRDVFGNPIISAAIPLGPSPVYVNFGSSLTIGQAAAAVEAGTIVASPGVDTGSFNPDFIARKLFRRTAGMPKKWYVLNPIHDADKTVYNTQLPAELAIAVRGGVKIEGAPYAWVPEPAVIEGNSSNLNLEVIFAPDNVCKTTLLYAEFYSPTARRGRVYYNGSDDVRMWVNGEKIADVLPNGPYQPNRYCAPGHPQGLGIDWGVKPGLMDIKEGRNTVVVKLHTFDGAFGLHFRIAWENFDTMTDLSWLPE